MLFRRIVVLALLVGGLSGLLLSGVQRWQVIPIIDQAERYEQARTVRVAEPGPSSVEAHSHADHAPASHSHSLAPPVAAPTATHSHEGHVHEEGAWEPADGAERIAFTVLSNVLTAAGFALLMLAAMSLAFKHRASNGKRSAATKLDWRYGLLWGLAGYAAFFLAPTLGLPPEIPGADAAPLEARQLWWIFAVAGTAGGLGVLAFAKSPWRWLGLALLAAPHLWGAPQLATSPFADFPPGMAADLAGLARRFVWATALANGLFWLALGALSGWAAQRFLREALVSDGDDRVFVPRRSALRRR